MKPRLYGRLKHNCGTTLPPWCGVRYRDFVIPMNIRANLSFSTFSVNFVVAQQEKNAGQSPPNQLTINPDSNKVQNGMKWNKTRNTMEHKSYD